jgi:hypothetical protein
LLNASLSSCCRYRPARASRRLNQFATSHAAFTPQSWVRPLDSDSRGHLCVHFRYSPTTCSPSHGWLCRSTPCAWFPPRMRSWLQGSDFYSGGSTSTEHISLLLDIRMGIPLPHGRERDAHSSARRSSSRHVRYRAVPRANRIPAPSSRAYQQKHTRVEGADMVMQSCGSRMVSQSLISRMTGKVPLTGQIGCLVRLVQRGGRNFRRGLVLK